MSFPHHHLPHAGKLIKAISDSSRPTFPLLILMPQTPSAFIGRLSKRGDNLAMWEYKLKIYASSIRGLYVLQGNEPCPNLPSLIPEPKFLGSRMDPEVSTAFAKDHRKWKTRHREELAAFEVAL